MPFSNIVLAEQYHFSAQINYLTNYSNFIINIYFGA